MAHELEVVNGVARFAFVGEQPWHGLGQEMAPGATPEEMKVAAGLDWTVEMRPLFTQDADGNYVDVPSRKVAVRSSDNSQLTVASPFWTPTQNSEFFAFCTEVASSTKSSVETAGSLRQGKTPFALLNLNQDFWVGQQADVVRSYLLLSWSHVVGRANKAKAVNKRVVCANTEAMAMAEGGLEYSQTHSALFDFNAVRDLFSQASAAVEVQCHNYDMLTQVKLGKFDVVRFLQPLLQPTTEAELAEENLSKERFLNRLMAGVGRNKAMDEVLDALETAPGALPGDVQSGWSVFNGLTYYTNHLAGRQRDARVTSAWFGDRADMVATAKKELLAMAS